MPVGGLEALQPLLPAEELILGNIGRGEFDLIGDGRLPEVGDLSRAVRAEFLRVLILGGEKGWRTHEKGVQLKGALITGLLDLEGCRISRGIALTSCRFEAAPIVRSAIIDNLVLDSSALPGLHAEVAEVRGSVTLVDAIFEGPISIYGARLGGRLNCDGATLACPNETVLAADLIVARSVVLRKATVVGGISLAGAKLSSDLDVSGIDIRHPNGIAFNADNIGVEGDIILSAAHVIGEMQIDGAHIAGDFDCSNIRIHNPGKTALKFNRSIVKGGFFLWKGAIVNGVLDMTGANVASIHDDLECWPAKGDLLLNRCLYDALIGGPVDAHARLEWLSRQYPQRWGEDFWPQPYEQLATVFRNMGHEEDARAVLIAKERLQRKARRDRSGSPIIKAVLAIKDGILAVTVLYGRQPLLAFFWLLLFWLTGVLIFGHAERHGAFKPASAVILRSPEWMLCGFDGSREVTPLATQQASRGRALPGQTQLDCYRSQLEAMSYPRFNAWMYSLDTLFPVLEVDQKNFWRPNPSVYSGTFALAYFYLQSIFGWALSLLAVAGFSGLVKSR